MNVNINDSDFDWFCGRTYPSAYSLSDGRVGFVNEDIEGKESKLKNRCRQSTQLLYTLQMERCSVQGTHFFGLQIVKEGKKKKSKPHLMK